jgi:hypothetical protein
MKRSARGLGLHVLSIVFAVLPFAFALIRAIGSGGQDLRYIWVALAALGGATAVVAAAGLHRRRLNAVAALFAAMFVSATLLALVAALLVGTVFGGGCWWLRLPSASVPLPAINSMSSHSTKIKEAAYFVAVVSDGREG